MKPWEAFQSAPQQDGPWSAYKTKEKVGASPVDPKQASLDALEGEGALGKAMINLGAGADTAWQGLKQLFGQGPSDAEIKDKRARDAMLAENTPGGGAIQFVGEVAPTLAIPGGAFVRGGQAVAKGMAPRAAAILDSAIAGGVTGAAQLTTEDESKILNSVVGAVGGAAIPGLIAGGKSVAQLLTSGGAESKAAAKLIEAAGGPQQAEAVLAKLRQQRTGVARDVPLSVAEVSQNPGLGRAERTASARHTEDWVPFREEQARGRWDALQRATAGADNAPALRANRDAVTAPLRQQALETAEGNDFISPVSAATAWLKDGSGGGNKAANSLADYVNSKIGPKTTPEQLYAIRKDLTDKLNGKVQIGDELSAATKSARRETMALVKSIDDALDGASGGQWTPYLEKYANESREVNSADALAKIRKWYQRDNTPQTAGVPSVTGHNLGTVIERTKGGYGDTLTAQARAGLQDVQDNLGATEGLQKLLKLTGTSGGGSNTAMDLTGIAADEAAGRLTSIVPVLGKLIDRSDKMTQAAMSDALRSPDVFIRGVTRKLEQRRPLTRSEENVLALIRAAGSGATLELAQPPQ